MLPAVSVSAIAPAVAGIALEKAVKEERRFSAGHGGVSGGADAAGEPQIGGLLHIILRPERADFFRGIAQQPQRYGDGLSHGDAVAGAEGPRCRSR